MIIKTLIADDEQHARDRLKDLLSDYAQFQIVAEAKDGASTLEKIVALSPDVAFLDINMPGVSIFKTIAALSDPPLVVFQTAHSNYATAAFDMEAVDYLLKPISRERFKRAVAKLMEKLSPNQPVSGGTEQAQIEIVDKIPVRIQGTIKLIQVKEIYRICFEEGLSFIYTEEGRFLADHSLNHYQAKLQPTGFFRSNRANLVNLDFVAKIHKAFKGNYLIELKDGSRIELSRRRAQAFKKKLDI